MKDPDDCASSGSFLYQRGIVNADDGCPDTANDLSSATRTWLRPPLEVFHDRNGTGYDDARTVSASATFSGSVLRSSSICSGVMLSCSSISSVIVAFCAVK